MTTSTSQTMAAAKGLVLVSGWVVSCVPGFLALVLWKSYGGHLHAPETLNLLLGHFLRAMLSVGIAVAAAAVAESAASAAIVTLGFTVGTWALDFIAAGRGGWLQQLANTRQPRRCDFLNTGRVGVWSKTDSVSYFDDYTVTQ